MFDFTARPLAEKKGVYSRYRKRAFHRLRLRPGVPRSRCRRRCRLTSARRIDLVVTDLAVNGFPGGQITLLETAPGVSVAEVIAATEADLSIPNNVPEMKI